MTVAALFVEARGIYSTIENVDVWDVTRDARTYDGPWPVICHPPCERYGRYWSGGPSARVRRIKGDDGGCFASALASVRRTGGVLEHPEASHAWRMFDIAAPPKTGGWIRAGVHVEGWTCCVEQGHYGHRARKATWLYYVGEAPPPSLKWGPARGKERLDEGFHSSAERLAARAAGRDAAMRISDYERRATPRAFAELLVDLARRARGVRAA